MAIPYTGEAAYGASYTFIRHDGWRRWAWKSPRTSRKWWTR